MKWRLTDCQSDGKSKVRRREGTSQDPKHIPPHLWNTVVWASMPAQVTGSLIFIDDITADGSSKINSEVHRGKYGQIWNPRFWLAVDGRSLRKVKSWATVAHVAGRRSASLKMKGLPTTGQPNRSSCEHLKVHRKLSLKAAAKVESGKHS